MAANSFSTSPAVVQQQLQSKEHDIRFNFSLYNAAALRQEWTFTQDYCAPCITSPTSWKFIMTLHRDPNSGVVYGNAILKRLDSLNVPVTAHFVLTFRHNAFSFDFVPTSHANRRIRPGDLKHSCIHTIVPNEFRDLLHREILVVLHISVRNCHQDSKKGLGKPVTGSRAGAGREKTRFSKM